MAHDVFLSYSRHDNAIMTRVQDGLRAAGLTIWTDQGIMPGSPSWKTAIEQAIRELGVVVVLFSPDSAASRWVRSELDFADSQRKPIYPLLVGGDEQNAVPFGFTAYQRIDLREKDGFDRGMTRLLAAIRSGESFPPVDVTETVKPSAERNRRLGLPLLAGVLAVLVIALISLPTLINAIRIQPPTPTVLPTVMPTPLVLGDGSSVASALAPEDIPEGWQVLQQDEIEIAVPGNWVRYIDITFLVETLELMFEGTTVDGKNLFAPDTIRFVSADLIAFRSLSMAKEEVGVELSRRLLETRMRLMYEQVGISEVARVSEAEEIELPVGTALRYQTVIDPEIAPGAAITYVVQHDGALYSLNVLYQHDDEAEVAVLVDQIVRTWRISE